MDAKPFTLQAPEDIAAKYGGNKQVIAHAAQIGMIDPTAAVMAGMFIDRMRAAAQAEQAPQQTVAQQVFSPPAPPMQQPPPQQGLGAIPPQGGPPPGGPPPPGMPPQGGPPPAGMPMGGGGPPPPGPPQGGLMAAGGAIPDGMFDSYASGGLVSFAAGGDGRMSPEEAQRQRLIAAGILPPEEVAPTPQGGIGTLAAAAPPQEGLALPPLGGALSPPPAQGGIMDLPGAPTPEARDSVAFVAPAAKPPAKPAPVRAQPAAAKAPPAPTTAASASAKTSTGTSKSSYYQQKFTEKYGVQPDLAAFLPENAAGLHVADALSPKNALSSINAMTEDYLRDIKTPEADAALEELKQTGEKMKLRKKEDLWQTLAEIGFGMAASKTRSFLGAAGEAAAAAMPAMAERTKERRAELKDARKERVAMEATANQQKLLGRAAMTDLLRSQVAAQGQDADRALQYATKRMEQAQAQFQTVVGFGEKADDRVVELQKANIQAAATRSAAHDTDHSRDVEWLSNEMVRRWHIPKEQAQGIIAGRLYGAKQQLLADVNAAKKGPNVVEIAQAGRKGGGDAPAAPESAVIQDLLAPPDSIMTPPTPPQAPPKVPVVSPKDAKDWTFINGMRGK